MSRQVIADALEAADHLDHIMPVTCALLRMMANDIPLGENMTTQTAQLNRVASSASEAIQIFIADRLANTDENGAAFTADQLRVYVNTHVEGGVSPSSADRVLRMLRQKGLVDYVVLNRGKSLYRAKPVVTVPPVVSDTN